MTVNLSDEAKQIYQEVEKRKQRVLDLGLDKLIVDLYYNYIQNYPDWMKYSHRHGCVCSLVTDAELIEGNDWTVKIVLFDKEYFFKRRPDKAYVSNDSSSRSTLALFCGSKKLFQLQVTNKPDKPPLDRLIFSLEVQSFIEGDWIQDFQAMKKRIEEEAKEREKKKAEDPEKLRKLKEDFGIEDQK